jgi:4-amino-4-deoxy-L-arabinose transferase-like glycosyltransferase
MQGMTPNSANPSQARPPIAWLLLLVAAALGYVFELGGAHIPRNGDELVYAHIARLTFESGHWLPLVSDLGAMRNTKPPLLFWQALAAGNISELLGGPWNLLALRLPSVFYTWGTTAMVGLLACKIALGAGKARREALVQGAVAALLYLSFFSTYRFGRPYLTSGPETFWLFAVFFALAWSPAKLLASTWKVPLLIGLATGLACLYKSFAMAVPLGFALALCLQIVGAQQPVWRLIRPGIVRDAAKVLGVCVLAWALFGLWFALDPQPGEVWREFVVGENAGKFKSGPGYFSQALSGSGGVLVIVLGYFSNTGLLMPVALGAAVAAWRAWRTPETREARISDAEKIMWLWAGALALVFMLPDQRSARYLIPAMPAVAVLMAVYYSRISRPWLWVCLLLCCLSAGALGVMAWGAVKATGQTELYSPLFWLGLVLILAAAATGIVRKQTLGAMTLVASYAVLISLTGVMAPFNHAPGQFKPATLALMAGQEVRVPNNFNGQFERYQFLLPASKPRPYDAPQPADFNGIEALLQKYRYVLVQRRAGQAPCTACRIIDVRWDIRSRQEAKEGTWAAFTSPETYWYAQEYLVESLTAKPP